MVRGVRLFHKKIVGKGSIFIYLIAGGLEIVIDSEEGFTKEETMPFILNPREYEEDTYETLQGFKEKIVNLAHETLGGKRGSLSGALANLEYEVMFNLMQHIKDTTWDKNKYEVGMILQANEHIKVNWAKPGDTFIISATHGGGMFLEGRYDVPNAFANLYFDIREDWGIPNLISVTKTNSGYRAEVKTNTNYNAEGKTSEEAVGKLMLDHGHKILVRVFNESNTPVK